MGKKEIAKRYVGLGLDISQFAKNAKTVEELLDKITKGRTVSLEAKLNLGNVQEILQKIVDQKTVSIRTALDVKDLMGIMEKSIADFEERGSTSLARMNRRFLEEFQTGLGGVNFKLDDGTLIGGYQQAIEQANKLNLVSEKQGKIADEVTVKTRKKVAAIQQEKKATEQLADAQKKLTDVSKPQSDNSKRINELKKIIEVQSNWIKYLDRSLNADNFKTSGKRQATEQLRTLTNSLASKRMNNYADDAWKQYPEEMAEVAWMEAYKEAQRQGVAQSTLTRYDTDAKYSYDRNLKTLQEEYDYRKKILDESKEQLKVLQEVASVENATGVAQQEKLNHFATLKNSIWDKQDNLTTEYQAVGKELDSLEQKYYSILGLVRQWQQLNTRINSISGRNSTDLRKNLLKELNGTSQELAQVIGDNFVSGLNNGFKGIKTVDIISMVSRISNADIMDGVSEPLKKLEELNLGNIDEAIVDSLRNSALIEPLNDAVGILDQISEKRKEQLAITQKQAEAQWELFDAMGKETEYRNSLLTDEDLKRIETEKQALSEQAKAQREASIAANKFKLADTEAGLLEQLRALDKARDWSDESIDILSTDEFNQYLQVLDAIIAKCENVGEAFRKLGTIAGENRNNYLREFSTKSLMADMVEELQGTAMRQEAGNVYALIDDIQTRPERRSDESLCKYIAQVIVGNSEVIQQKRQELESQLAELENLQNYYDDLLTKREDYLWSAGFDPNSRYDVNDDSIYTKIKTEYDKVVSVIADIRSQIEEIDHATVEFEPIVKDNFIKSFENNLISQFSKPIQIPAKIEFNIEDQSNIIGQLNDNAEQLKFSDGTVLSEKEVSAVKKYCEVLKNSMGEAYDEALNLKAALDLVFNIKTGNIEALIDRFNAGNKASNAALKIMTGMPVNNQANRNLALRSTNPSVYDQIKADAEKAKAELANQKTDFQIKWEEFVSAMLGGDAFKDESNLVKGKILKEFSSYADTASGAIDKLNKAWLSGNLEGKSGKTKYIQTYIDYLNSQKEYFDSIRNAKAGDMDIDSLFGLNGTKGITEEKAKALRDEAVAWDTLIDQKKKYYGIDSANESSPTRPVDRAAEIQKQLIEFQVSYNSLQEEFGNTDTFETAWNKFYKTVESGARTSIDAISALKEEMKSIGPPTEAQSTDESVAVAVAAEKAADAEERKAEAAGETRKQLEGQKKEQTEISAEAIIERDIEKALSQLRSAKDNETTLINLKGVFSGDDLVEQFSSMVQKIAEQANLSVGKITVKDNIAQVRLYNEELKVTVDQMYQLKQATEEADSAQLELVSQSFSQNVKALNENSFDIDGFRARAVAAVEKVRSSLHGLEYDLTDLENAARNISSKDDFTKFNNQLKAAQDNIQAIKNATVSQSSMNQLANMQRDMKNANIELETMRIKLQKIGDIDGVADAKKMIDDMASAAQKFNEAQDAQSQQDAYSKYSDTRSSFKAQLEYLNAVKSFNASQASASKQTVDPIKEQYKSILDTVNKINSINSEILKFQKQDAGSGLYSGYIEQLQAGKEQLIAQLQSTIQEIDATLSGGFVQGKEISVPSIKFLDDNGAVASFLNDTKTQASLTAEEIDKLVASLQKAQSIDVQAAAKVAEQFRSVQETYKQITSLSTLDTNGSLYKGIENVFAQIIQYKNMLSSDPTQWTPEQSQNLQTLINKFNEYGNVLVQVGQKEQQYFAGKQKYTTDTSMQSMAEDAKKAAEEVSTAQQKLTNAAQQFAKESGASGAIITNFVQGADGIARLDFSVLDSGTNSLRKFRMEMGSVSDGAYITETTINNFVSKAQAAAKQLESISDLISRLQISGTDMDQGSVAKLVQLQKELNAELSKGDAADETVIAKLTKDAKISQAEVEKLYKKHIQLQEAIENNEAEDLGSIDFNGDVYKQLTEGIEAFAKANDGTNVKIGKLNERTGQLKFTMNAADGTVKEFTVSLDRLGKIAVAQETGVQNLGSKWDQFKNSLSKTGKQLMTALVGYNVFFKAISEVRKGVNYVKEIDLAMTELKKVTDETEASYNKFLETASKTASVIGSTISDFTEATANFARLGYTMEESAKMAETAIVYKNVADGLDTVEESTESIISTMKAFGIESDDTMSIIDRFNEVGNNFAITSAGIGEALQRSASALYEAGNTIDESIGLVTAANSVIQNPEQVGTALKTLALRIRGVKTELEEAGLETEGMAETTSQLQAKIKALTNGKVDIMLNADEFKSTTQILREMSAVWQEMTDVQRAAALELLGGKVCHNVQ